MSEEQSKFRSVNQTLGTSPGIGPLAANQLIPWAILSGLAWLIGQGILSLGAVKTAFLGAWLILSWWALTGNAPWKYMAKFVAAPNWCRGYGQYQPILVG